MAGGCEGKLEQAGLGEGPAGEGWGLGGGGFAEAYLGVAVLEFLDHLARQGAAAGDFGQVLGHLAEDVGGSVGKEENGGRVVCGLVHCDLVRPSGVLFYVGCGPKSD